jgi:hypothetical protein
MNRKSKRFNPNRLTERLVPFMLILIVVGLAVTVIVTVLAVLGLTPSF